MGGLVGWGVSARRSGLCSTWSLIPQGASLPPRSSWREKPRFWSPRFCLMLLARACHKPSQIPGVRDRDQFPKGRDAGKCWLPSPHMLLKRPRMPGFLRFASQEVSSCHSVLPSTDVLAPRAGLQRVRLGHELGCPFFPSLSKNSIAEKVTAYISGLSLSPMPRQLHWRGHTKIPPSVILMTLYLFLLRN